MTRRIVTKVTNEEREAVAPRTIINWDPATNDGVVEFHVQDMVFVNGQYRGMEINRELNVETTIGVLYVPINEVLSDAITYQLPDGSTKTLAGYELMFAIKAYFDAKYDAYIAEKENAGTTEEEE